jgi:hypothetical protein
MALVIITAKRTKLDGQDSKAFPVGVEVEIGVRLGRGVGEAVGRGLLVLVLIPVLVPVGITGSVPVIDTNRSRTRA